ncbi:MAG: hypothetical protein R2771_13580 [Saprospiraceae bacterium]
MNESTYSVNLKRIAYEKYILDIEKNLDLQVELIAKKSKKYKLYGETYDSGKIYNKKYILTNKSIQFLLANYILDNNLLSSCEYFDKNAITENQVYDYSIEFPFQFGYAEFIAFLMKDNTDKLIELKKVSKNQCTVENINYIYSIGKRVPYLKKYYK